MVLAGTINGTTIPTGRIRLHTAEDEGISGLTGSADGSGSQGAITFDDPDHSLTLQGFDYVTVEETDCIDAPRLFTGYLADRTTTHGKYLTDGGRQIDATINDPNTLLTWLLITGSDGKRPAETRAQRIDWLMGSAYWPPNVFDVGWIVPGAHDFEEADYRRQYAADVLSDILETYQTFFVKWDPVTEQLGLFYGAANSSLLTSPLTISNDMADVDFNVCFPPLRDSSLAQDPSAVYSLVDLEYTGGDIRQEDPAVTAQFFSTVGPRGVAVNESRIGKLTTAQHFLTAYLAQDATEDATVACSLILPSTHVGLLSEGDRVSVRFMHLDGYEAFTWTRVRTKTLRTVEDRRDLYLLTLTLNDRGPFGAAGGGGGTSNPPPTVFPPPTPTPTHYYSGQMTSVTEFYAVADSTLVGGSDSGWGDGTTSSTQLGTATFLAGTTYNYDVTVVTDALDVPLAKQWGLGRNGTWLAPHVVDPGSTQHWTGSFTPSAGGTTGEMVFSQSGFSHGNRAYAVTWFIDPVGWNSSPTPPAPGQQNARPEIATMTGVNGTTLFPFADGTLRVLYDIVDQTPAIVSYDGAAGTFVMPSAPPLGTQVFVEYLGR
jgi:hypothetical protein